MRKRTLVLMTMLCAACVISGCRVGAVGSKGDVGQYIIDVSGGRGGANTDGAGGDAGYLELYSEYSSGADLICSNVGEVDASFEPSNPAGEVGDNPLVVSGDLTLSVDPATPATGVAYLVSGDSNVYISDGDVDLADEDPVTGIRVNGGTLTCELNMGGTYCYIDLNRDFINNGTVTTVDVDDLNRGDLQIYASSFVNRGTIALQGTKAGQNGGFLNIYIDQAVYNHGPINTYGAANVDGDAGDGGYFYASCDDSLFENTARISTYGGSATGTTGAGGDGGYIDWETYYGDIHNSGTLNCYGGNGVLDGGDGGYFYVYIEYCGSLLNQGALNFYGGDSLESSGGSAGFYSSSYSLYWEVYGGALKSSGNIDLHGGSTSGLELGDNGGDAGGIYAKTEYEGDGEPTYGYNIPGEVVFSGNIIARGGSVPADSSAMGTGGEGGDIYLEHDPEDYAKYQEFGLKGYSLIKANGGDGNDGGDGGYVDFFNGYGETSDLYFNGGSVINHANIQAKGGNGLLGESTTTSSGGAGGYVELETDYNIYMAELDPAQYGELVRTINYGDINVSGGTSYNNTDAEDAMGGSVWFYGVEGVENYGALTCVGGNDTGDNGYGGDGGWVELEGEGELVLNHGTINVSGGNGAYLGGSADEVWIANQYAIDCQGAVIANGGNANPDLSGSQGGDSGYIELWTATGLSQIQYSTVQSNAGTGATEGYLDDVIVGGMLLQENND